MTGTLAQEQGYGLDPRPSHDADENHAEPILAACEIDAERTARMAVQIFCRAERACILIAWLHHGHALPDASCGAEVGHVRCDTSEVHRHQGRRHYRARSGGEALLTTL